MPDFDDDFAVSGGHQSLEAGPGTSFAPTFALSAAISTVQLTVRDPLPVTRFVSRPSRPSTAAPLRTTSCLFRHTKTRPTTLWPEPTWHPFTSRLAWGRVPGAEPQIVEVTTTSGPTGASFGCESITTSSRRASFWTAAPCRTLLLHRHHSRSCEFE